ncbi:MAG: hypothetical protein SOR89_01670 [Ndongobacter sp.]|nr:hypothetical protein [Ndongobacter sp.]
MRALFRDASYYFLYSGKWLLLFLLALFGVQYVVASEGAEFGLSAMEAWVTIVLRDSGLAIDYAKFQFPFMWVLIHYVPIMAFSNAFWKDHTNNGVYLITQAGSRGRYFGAAAVSGIVLCVLLQAVEAVLLLLASLLVGGAEWARGYEFFLRIHAFIALENSVLIVLLNMLALYFGYRVGMISVLLWLGFVTLVPFQGLLGSGSLVFRQDVVDPMGYGWGGNLAVCAVYALIAAGLYLWRAKTYDFYSEVLS